MIIEWLDMTVSGPVLVHSTESLREDILLPSYGDTVDIQGKKYNIDDRIFRLLKDGVSFHVIIELQSLDK